MSKVFPDQPSFCTLASSEVGSALSVFTPSSKQFNGHLGTQYLMLVPSSPRVQVQLPGKCIRAGLGILMLV